jgi:hypothetical protein
MRRERRTLAFGRLLATRAAMTVITLSSALTVFSYCGLAAGGKSANLSEHLIAAASYAAPEGSNPESINPDLLRQLEANPEIKLQFDNSPDAPLVITGASLKAVKRPPLTDPSVPPNRYLISPDVELQNRTNKRVTGLVLRFVCAGSAPRTYSGEGELNVMPGGDYRFKMKPRSDTFTLDGDPNWLRVNVAAVLLEGEDLWVSVDQTGRQPKGTIGTRSDRGPSHPSSPSEVTSTTPGPPDQSESHSPAGVAKTVSDAACNGFNCPLSILKVIGQRIGLTVVFEESAEARIQSAGNYYLFSLGDGELIEIMLRLNHLKYIRAGDHLTVKPDASPESLHRLILAN